LRGCPRSHEAGRTSMGDSGREEKNFWARPRPRVPEAEVNMIKTNRIDVSDGTPPSATETSRLTSSSGGNKRRRSSQPLKSAGAEISHETRI
jgi:hypothetical protein